MIKNLAIVAIVTILNIPSNHPFIPRLRQTPDFFNSEKTRPVEFLSKFDIKKYILDSNYKIKSDNPVGFLTDSKKLLGPFEDNKFYIGMHDYSTGFSEGLAPVKNKGYWGYIDEDGNKIVDFSFDSATIFKNGLAVVSQNGEYRYINKNGEFLFDKSFENAFLFDRNVALVKNNGLYGFLDSNGQLICDYKYDNLDFPKYSISPTSNEIMVLYKDDLCAYVSVNSSEIAPLTDFKYYKLYPYTRSSELEFVKSIKKGSEYVDFVHGFMDEDFKEVFSYTESEYQFVNPLYDQLHHFATIDGFHGFMDENFNVVIEAKFHYAKTFSHGLCIVENLEQFGLIDKKGNFILDFQDTPLKSFEVNEGDLILHSNKQNNDISATIKDYFKNGFPKINSKDLIWSQ